MKLKDSGYPEEFRAKVISQAMKIYQNQVKKDVEGVKPLYRTRDLILKDRKEKEKNKYKWWNRGGTHNAIMFVPPTPGGVLKNMLNLQIIKV